MALPHPPPDDPVNVNNDDQQPSPSSPTGAHRPSSASPVPPSSYYHGAAAARDAAPSRSSRTSEGYPSWLPRRPPPPAPASTIGTNTPAPFDRSEYFANDDANDNDDLDLDAELRHLDQQYAAHGGTDEDDDENSPVAPNPLLLGGRKPTPRSVRIVKLDSSITEEPRVGAAEDVAAPAAAPGVRASYATSYAHWNTRAKRQNRISSGSTAVAQPPNAVPPRGWTRANAPPTMFNSVASSFYPQDLGESRPRPRFNTRGLHLELLRSPSVWMKVYYRLYPLLFLAHIPLQTFLDFNIAYMLVQVSRHPLPNAAPTSSKNWALGAAAYVASWFTWILVVLIIHEVVYSFARRWRVRRPLIFPLYISSAGFNWACTTSYNTFCFLQHLRWTAFFPISPDLDGLTSSSSSSAHQRTDSSSSVSSAHETDPALGGPPAAKFTASPGTKEPLKKRWARFKKTWSTITWRDGLAETCNWYAQNVPTVVTLLPRAGLALALLLAFSPGIVGSSARSFASARDSTFFNSSTGLLTGYGQAILWVCVAWTAWRVLVLWVSWIGLWILSGHTCAGICGPRDKWEEEDLNRLTASLARARRAPYSPPITTEPKGALPPDPTSQAGRTEVISAGAGRRIIHKRFASNWSNGSGGSSADGDDDILPWEWRECTRARVQDAWEFCVVGDGGRLRWGAAPHSPAPQLPPISALNEDDDDEKIKKPRTPKHKRREESEGGLDEEGLQRVLAAVGFPTPGVPTPARRGALRSDLFESPSKARGSSSSPPGRVSPSAFGAAAAAAGAAAMLTDKDDEDDDNDDGAERMEMGERKPMPPLTYPFAQRGSGFVSSKDDGLLVPFPKGGEPAPSSKAGSKRTSKANTPSAGASRHPSQEPPSSRESPPGVGAVEEPSSSSHAYSSEPSSSSSSLHHGSHASRRGSQSNSLSSLGQPIPPSSAVFVSRGMRPLTASGGTAYTGATTTSHVSHRHSSLGSMGTSASGGGALDPRETSGSSGGLGGTSGNAGILESSPVSAGSRTAAGGTRFPFLSGPPPPPAGMWSPGGSGPQPPFGMGMMGMGGIGPSTHFGVHGRRVVMQHTGGNGSSMNTSTSGSAHGHGTHYGHRRGMSHASGMSSGLGSDMGYAASGSGEGDIDEEILEEARRRRRHVLSEDEEERRSLGVDEFGRTRDRDRASLSQSSGGSGGGVPVEAAVGVIPMPRRHPHAGGRARAGTAPSSGSSVAASRSSSSGQSKTSSRGHAGGIAFPTSDGENTAEIGMVTGYARGMGMEMLSIEASDSLARREREGRRGVVQGSWFHEEDDDEPTHIRDSTVTAMPHAQAQADDDDDKSVYDDDEDRDHHEAELREREDRVGLLSSSLQASAASLHHSPSRASVGGAVDQLGQLHPSDANPRSRRSSRRSSTQRRSRESLTAAVAAAASRSRHSSYIRSQRTSFAASPPASPGAGPSSPSRRDSLLGAARERASSFGVRVRERAQSLMQSVVGVGAGARERTTSEVGAARHRRLGSGDASATGTFSFAGQASPPPLPMPPSSPLAAAQAPAAAPSALSATRALQAPPPMTERSVSGGSSSSGGGAVVLPGQHHRVVSEGEFSSSSHSRSGSESVRDQENYTFGQPIPFLQRRENGSGDLAEGQQGEEYRGEEEEEGMREHVRERTTSMAPSTSTAGQEVFYSPIGGPTPLQSGLTTPVPAVHVPVGLDVELEQQQQQHPEFDVPWTQRLLEPPPRHGAPRDQSLAPSGGSSGDMMLSSAAASFVTARADAQSMFTMTTTSGGDSSERATLTGSWEEARGSGFVGALLGARRGGTVSRGRERRDGGMVERAGEGAAAGWVPGAGELGDGRIA